MNYHKASRISLPEADFLRSKPSQSLNACVVVENFGDWYDVRRMTETELGVFLESLYRVRLADEAAASRTPH